MPLKTEIANRIAALQSELKKKELDGALITHPIDIYYFSGTRQNSLCWVPAQGAAMLLVRKSFQRAKLEACIEDIRPFPSSKQIPELFAGVGRIGLTSDVLPVAQLNYFEKILPGRQFADISAINRSLRSVKSAWEIERMREGAEQLCSVFAQVPEFLKPGMREIDLAAEFECRLRKLGHEGYIRMRAYNQELFQGLVMAGESAAAPGFFDGAATGPGLSNASPHGPSRARIEPNLPILVDYTSVFEGYIVDMTRIFVFGDLDARARHAFDTARAIQDALAAELKPGVICSALFQKAAAMAAEAGLGECFMGVPGEQAKFVGHGVGLELDEMPVLAQGFDQPLVAGQTIAVEPKFVIPGKGVIGIENTFAVSASGGVKITDYRDDFVRL